MFANGLLDHPAAHLPPEVNHCGPARRRAFGGSAETFGDIQVGIGKPKAAARVIHKIWHTLNSSDSNAPL